MKTCTKCGETKDRSEFYSRSRSPDGHEAWCKICRLEHNRNWSDKNKQRHRALNRRRHAENKEAVALAAKERYEKNKHKYLMKYYEREKRTKRAIPNWYNKKMVRAYYSMARFLSCVVGRQYHVDHVVPITSKLVCGLHVQNNLSIIPATDNWSKLNTRWPDMP